MPSALALDAAWSASPRLSGLLESEATARSAEKEPTNNPSTSCLPPPSARYLPSPAGCLPSPFVGRRARASAEAAGLESAEIGSAGIGSAGIGSAEIGSDEIGSDEIGSAEVCSRRRVRESDETKTSQPGKASLVQEAARPEGASAQPVSEVSMAEESHGQPGLEVGSSARGAPG